MMTNTSNVTYSSSLQVSLYAANEIYSVNDETIQFVMKFGINSTGYFTGSLTLVSSRM